MEVTYLAFANSSVKRLVKWEETKTHSKGRNLKSKILNHEYVSTDLFESYYK